MYKLEKILFTNLNDALTTISVMNDILKKYGCVTVADLYDIGGLNPDYKDNKYGWENLDRISIIKDETMYRLDISDPIELDKTEPKAKYNPVEVAYKILVDAFNKGNELECSLAIESAIGYLGEAMD